MPVIGRGKGGGGRGRGGGGIILCDYAAVGWRGKRFNNSWGYTRWFFTESWPRPPPPVSYRSLAFPRSPWLDSDRLPVFFFFLFSSDYCRIFYASSDFFRFSLYGSPSFFFYPDVGIVEQSLYWNEVFYSSNSSFFFKYRCICLQFMRRVLIYLWKIFGRSKNEKNIY